MDFLIDHFDNSDRFPEALNHVYIKDTEVDALVLMVKDSVTNPTDLETIDWWIWNNEDILKQKFNVLDIELNFELTS